MPYLARKQEQRSYPVAEPEQPKKEQTNPQIEDDPNWEYNTLPEWIKERRKNRIIAAHELWDRLELDFNGKKIDDSEIEILKNLLKLYASSVSDVAAKESFIKHLVFNGHFVSSDTPGVGKMMAQELPAVMPSAAEMDEYLKTNKIDLLPYLKDTSDKKLTPEEVIKIAEKRKQKKAELEEGRLKLAKEAWAKLSHLLIKNNIDPLQQEGAKDLIMEFYAKSSNDAAAKEAFMDVILTSKIYLSANTFGVGKLMAQVLPNVMPTKAELRAHYADNVKKNNAIV